MSHEILRVNAVILVTKAKELLELVVGVMVIGLWTTQSLSWTELWSRCGSPSKVVLNEHVKFHGWQLQNKDRAFVTFALTVGPAVTDPFAFILTVWAWDAWATVKHISKDLWVVAENGWKELVQCIFNLTRVKFGPATIMFARKCLPKRHDLHPWNRIMDDGRLLSAASEFWRGNGELVTGGCAWSDHPTQHIVGIPTLRRTHSFPPEYPPSSSSTVKLPHFIVLCSTGQSSTCW